MHLRYLEEILNMALLLLKTEKLKHAAIIGEGLLESDEGLLESLGQRLQYI